MNLCIPRIFSFAKWACFLMGANKLNIPKRQMTMSRSFFTATTTIYFVMPATRSSGQQTRSQPFPTSSPPRSQNLTATRRTKTTTPEIVPSSSSEADSSTTTTKKQPRKRNEKVKSRSRHPVVIPEDIIEISSDDETLPISKPTTTPAALLTEPAAIADFRRQISKYREVRRLCQSNATREWLTWPLLASGICQVQTGFRKNFERVGRSP